MKSALTSLALFLAVAGRAFAADSGNNNNSYNNVGSNIGNGVGNGVGNGRNGVGNGNLTITNSISFGMTIPWQVDGTNIFFAERHWRGLYLGIERRYYYRQR
jgi:hypothetical protein